MHRVKIGVLSDTHAAEYSEELARIAELHFNNVELILHAGDMVDLSVLDALHPKKVEAVAGNMDSQGVRNKYPVKQVVSVGGFRIGLIHGWGSPRGIEERIRQEFADVDCIVYGHTHAAACHESNGILFFNPGSAMEKRYTKSNSVGILEIGTTVTGKIIVL